MKCEKCGSENIIEGKLTSGLGGVIFTTEKSKKSFNRNYSTIKANACKDCGQIFSLQLVNPENVNPNR